MKVVVQYFWHRFTFKFSHFYFVVELKINDSADAANCARSSIFGKL